MTLLGSQHSSCQHQLFLLRKLETVSVSNIFSKIFYKCQIENVLSPFNGFHKKSPVTDKSSSMVLSTAAPELRPMLPCTLCKRGKHSLKCLQVFGMTVRHHGNSSVNFRFCEPAGPRDWGCPSFLTYHDGWLWMRCGSQSWLYENLVWRVVMYDITVDCCDVWF